MQVVPSLIDNFDPFAMFESFFGHHRKYGSFSNFGFGGFGDDDDDPFKNGFNKHKFGFGFDDDDFGFGGDFVMDLEKV